MILLDMSGMFDESFCQFIVLKYKWTLYTSFMVQFFFRLLCGQFVWYSVG